jgi:hypothetical protein
MISSGFRLQEGNLTFHVSQRERRGKGPEASPKMVVGISV